MSAAAYIDQMFGSGLNPTESQLWQISRITRGVIGVHSFGFDESGNRSSTNLGASDAEEDRRSTFVVFLNLAAQAAEDESKIYEEVGHDYPWKTKVCSQKTDRPWCTLVNIACWGRYFYAPNKQGGYDDPETYASPVAHEDVSELDPYVFDFLGGPVQTAVGTGAKGGLPENAIANITMPGHFLHNPDMQQWPICPKAVSEQGRGDPPTDCNQVYREPFLDDDGNIYMYTRGTGTNKFDYLNERLGPALFQRLDEAMMKRIGEDEDGLCPSLEPE